MFKDYKKYLTVSIKVYLFVLLIVVILKVVGFNYFGLDIENPIINSINVFIDNYHLDDFFTII
jgi:hypothetical protein